MGWLEGLLTGYVDRSHEIEKQKLDEAVRSQEQEARIYQVLLNSEDENLKQYAAAGMLDMANPLRKSKGLRGWMGEVERSPMLPIIRKYMNTPQAYEETTTVPGLNSTQTTGYTSLPPSGQPSRVSAALSAESPTEAGTAPITAPVPAPPPPSQPPPPPPGPGGAPGAARVDPSVAPGATILTNPPIQGPPLPPGQQNPDPGFSVQPPPGMTNPDPGFLRESVGQAAPTPIAPPQAAPQVAPPPLVAPPLIGPPPPPPGSTEVQYGLSPNVAPSTFGEQNAYEPNKAFRSGNTEPPPLPTPPPLPPESMSNTRQVAGTPWEQTETRYRLPTFPTTGDTFATNEAGKVRGEIRGLQEAFRMQGDPNWQRSGLDAYLAQHIRATAGSTRAVQTREMIAFKMFGKAGDDPTQVMRNLTPKQMGRVLDEDNINAAERALIRAKAMADAPLTAQARSNLIETLNTKWRSAERPRRDMQRALQEMEVGVRRFNQDPIGASQAVLITFQKILDPDSVVREGEYDRSPAGLAIIPRIQGMYDRYIGKWDPVAQRWVGGGAGVPLAELEGMFETAKQFLAGMENFNNDERRRLENRAAEHDIDPGLIFGGELRGVTPPPPPPVTPPPMTPPVAGGPVTSPVTPPVVAPPVTPPAAPDAGAPRPGSPESRGYYQSKVPPYTTYWNGVPF